MKNKMTHKQQIMFCLSVLCLFMTACSKPGSDQISDHNETGPKPSQVIPNALKLSSLSPNQLQNCQPNSAHLNPNSTECPTGFECASLSMTGGSVDKCVEISKICDQSTCNEGNCLAVMSEPAQVACVTAVDNQYGAMNAAPPSSAGVPDQAVATLLLNHVSGLKISDSRLVFNAIDPDGKPAQIYLPGAKGQECENQISLAISGQESLSILGSWSAVSLPSFNGTTYQFSEGSYCYHGVPIGL